MPKYTEQAYSALRGSREKIDFLQGLNGEITANGSFATYAARIASGPLTDSDPDVVVKGFGVMASSLAAEPNMATYIARTAEPALKHQSPAVRQLALQMYAACVQANPNLGAFILERIKPVENDTDPQVRAAVIATLDAVENASPACARTVKTHRQNLKAPGP